MTEPEIDSTAKPATGRATLALNTDAATSEAPALKKKGRGWEISDSRLNALVAHGLACIPTLRPWSFS